MRLAGLVAMCALTCARLLLLLPRARRRHRLELHRQVPKHAEEHRATQVPLQRLLRKALPVLGRGTHAASRRHLLQHKGQQPREYGADGPHGVPGLGVEIAHAEAQARVGGEAAVGRDHANGWRLEGVLLGEHNLAVVVAARVRGALRALQHVVPLQNVGGRGVRGHILHGVFEQGLVLLLQAQRCLVHHLPPLTQPPATRVRR
mmetsp:Transcript_27324/g.52013  ORF Transcript_27324/g.52013 Transcript_27324/m.52013 type:complete len:204 (+) Transcript_27324:622-1233(+)